MKSWSDRVAILKAKGGKFATTDRDLARAWSTCAIAELSPLIPRWGEGVPFDPHLVRLGCAFATQACLESPDADRLQGLLDSMREREAQLLE
jgi:hypothetical protein